LIGLLSPPALAASLLDWHLGKFFDGVSKIAADVDALDERVLCKKASRILLGRIVTLRRRTSRLREPLVRNRVVFYGLARPDLVFIANSESVSNYQLLATLFERALDEVEHVRDFISGSFLIVLVVQRDRNQRARQSLNHCNYRIRQFLVPPLAFSG
jgi:magnesium transporter